MRIGSVTKQSAERLFSTMSATAEARFWRRVVSRLVASHPERATRIDLDSLLTAPALGVATEDGRLILAVGDE